MKNLLKIIILSILFFSFSCKDATEQNTTQEVVEEVTKTESAISNGQTKAVLKHHLETFGANDLAGIMSDYTEESVVVTPDSTYTGLVSIKSMFEGLFSAFPTEGTTINMDKMVVDNDLAFIIWNGESPSLNVPFATDTFIIVDGKIMKQTFAGVINPKE